MRSTPALLTARQQLRLPLQHLETVSVSRTTRLPLSNATCFFEALDVFTHVTFVDDLVHGRRRTSRKIRR